jgi:hypothetical protein
MQFFKYPVIPEIDNALLGRFIHYHRAGKVEKHVVTFQNTVLLACNIG